MKYFEIIWLMVMVATLAGCDAMQQNGARAGGGVSNAYNATRYKVSRYIYGEKPVEQVAEFVAPPPATFCYQAQLDIMCFDRPKPEMYLNLIAVHGEHNYSYQDFLPANLRAGNMRAGDNNSSGGFSGYNGGNDNLGRIKVGNDITMSDILANNVSENNMSASNVNVGNNGRNMASTHNSPQNSPFYYSPSPATRDPFGDGAGVRSKHIP